MNELRHCAPLSLKNTLASELKRALQSVSDYLYYFNSSSRLIKDDEISLFMGMCRTFIEVRIILKAFEVSWRKIMIE